jgi:hypothetical protein
VARGKKKTARATTGAVARTFYLPLEISNRLNEMATTEGVSYSGMLCALIWDRPYALVFSLFRNGVNFSEIVIQTNLPPNVVIELHEQYKAGLERTSAPRVDWEALAKQRQMEIDQLRQQLARAS